MTTEAKAPSVIQTETIEGYDIIGDVHGCARTLKALLNKLGYQEENGLYFYPGRRLVFVGDIVDRGPRIRPTISLIKNLVEADLAYCVLGNHEFNAVAYTTCLNDATGADKNATIEELRYLRAHNSRNNRLIQETLIQYAPYPEEWRQVLEWFKTLPVLLELPGFRVVHACWDDESVTILREATGQKNPTLNHVLPFLVAGDRRVAHALDRAIRGTSLRYPDGRYALGRDGLKRDFFRTKFWAINPHIYQDVVFQPDPLPEFLVNRALSDDEKSRLLSYPADAPPVFFGHYWLQGRPRVQRANLACLDYSAVKFGRLCAYRFDGESVLNADKFVWVYVDPKTAKPCDSSRSV